MLLEAGGKKKRERRVGYRRKKKGGKKVNGDTKKATRQVRGDIILHQTQVHKKECLKMSTIVTTLPQEREREISK